MSPLDARGGVVDRREEALLGHVLVERHLPEHVQYGFWKKGYEFSNYIMMIGLNDIVFVHYL